MPRARTPFLPFDLVISCEHGGNRIPPPYRKLFRRARGVLATHRGYDRGALAIARDFARALRAPLVFSTVSRLLVELNRSPGHRQSFSRFVPSSLHAELSARYYRPYRERLEAHVGAAVRRGRRVLHLSCHSFTPRLKGVRRNADLGLLFDPRRRPERSFCDAWQRALAVRSRLVVRRNYPYRGSADGLTTALRRRFPANLYLGVELEVNQRFARAGGPRWRRLRRLLVASFSDALNSGSGS